MPSILGIGRRKKEKKEKRKAYLIALEKKADELKNDNESLDEDLNACKGVCRRQEIRIDTLVEECRDLTNRNKELQNSFDFNLKRFNEESSKNIQKTRQILEGLQERDQKRTQKISALKDENEKKRKEKGELLHKVNDLVKELMNSGKKAEQGKEENAKLHADLETYKNINKSLLEEITRKEKAFQESELAVRQLGSENGRLSEEMAKCLGAAETNVLLSTNNANLCRDLDDKDKIIKGLLVNKAEIEQDFELMKKALKSESEENERLRKEMLKSKKEAIFRLLKIKLEQELSKKSPSKSDKGLQVDLTQTRDNVDNAQKIPEQEISKAVAMAPVPTEKIPEVPKKAKSETKVEVTKPSTVCTTNAPLTGSVDPIKKDNISRNQPSDSKTEVGIKQPPTVVPYGIMASVERVTGCSVAVAAFKLEKKDIENAINYPIKREKINKKQSSNNNSKAKNELALCLEANLTQSLRPRRARRGKFDIGKNSSAEMIKNSATFKSKQIASNVTDPTPREVFRPITIVKRKTENQRPVLTPSPEPSLKPEPVSKVPTANISLEDPAIVSFGLLPSGTKISADFSPAIDDPSILTVVRKGEVTIDDPSILTVVRKGGH